MFGSKNRGQFEFEINWQNHTLLTGQGVPEMCTSRRKNYNNTLLNKMTGSHHWLLILLITLIFKHTNIKHVKLSRKRKIQIVGNILTMNFTIN